MMGFFYMVVIEFYNLAVNCKTTVVKICKKLLMSYRNLPNKGAGRSNMVRFDRLREKLRFSAFQWWFRILKKLCQFQPFMYIGFLQTKGAPLLGEAPLIGRLRISICHGICHQHKKAEVVQITKVTNLYRLLLWQFCNFQRNMIKGVFINLFMYSLGLNPDFLSLN